jgi:hypothetical protein
MNPIYTVVSLESAWLERNCCTIKGSYVLTVIKLKISPIGFPALVAHAKPRSQSTRSSAMMYTIKHTTIIVTIHPQAFILRDLTTT